MRATTLRQYTSQFKDILIADFYYFHVSFGCYLSELCSDIVLQIFGRLCSGVFISTLQPADKLLQHSGCA